MKGAAAEGVTIGGSKLIGDPDQDMAISAL